MMKKGVLVSASVLLLLLSTMLLRVGASEAKLLVHPAAKTVKVNDIFTVDINVTDVENFCGLYFRLTWNSAVLNCTGDGIHPPGVWGSDWWVLENETERIKTGTYEIALVSLYPAPPFNGSVSLVTLSFQALAFGSTSMVFEESTFGNSTGCAISHGTVSGSVAVERPVGGVWIPPNKLELLIPYIKVGVFLAIFVVVAIVYVKWRRGRAKED